MASTERSVEIPRPPAEVFPWLFEEDKVPQWTTGLEHYERLDSGPLGGRALPAEARGLRPALHGRAGGLRVRPARGAATRSRSAASTWSRATRWRQRRRDSLTQSVEAKGGGIKGRLFIPMIQPHLERKLEADLAALKQLLSKARCCAASSGLARSVDSCARVVPRQS